MLHSMDMENTKKALLIDQLARTLCEHSGQFVEWDDAYFTAKQLYRRMVKALLEKQQELEGPKRAEVVAECIKAYDAAPWQDESMLAALRRYRELGCPDLDK